MTEKVRKSSGRRELEELIETCTAIENRRFNPFLLDIGEALRIIRKNSKNWENLQDNLLDMRAITSLAKVVGLQSANLRFQSTSLFVDPAMLKQKIDAMSREQLAEYLLLSWHPVVELEQITEKSTKEAMEYWNQMLSFFERRRKLFPGAFEAPGSADSVELATLRILDEKAFSKRLEEFWKHLKERTLDNGRADYWNLVRGSDFAETVSRAQMVSFLVSYGMATLEKKREKLYIVAKDPPFASREGSPVSFPIPIPNEANTR
ncbi:MAG TPA: hypothetical protein VFE98_11180 [Candidatus Bathyarchaeia archaeon]|nr:hypothetical protein [Candidatus Bathyarchaeia archaeon]